MEKKRYSGITKVNGKAFRYDYKHACVQYVSKVDAETLEENENWIKEFGHPLFHIDSTGYIVNLEAGLQIEHWTNREARAEYLEEWSYEIEEEIRYMI